MLGVNPIIILLKKPPKNIKKGKIFFLNVTASIKSISATNNIENISGIRLTGLLALHD